MISTMRRHGNGLVLYGIVTDTLQRMTVAVPYKFATTDQAEQIIEHAIAGLDRPAKPVHATSGGN